MYRQIDFNMYICIYLSLLENDTAMGKKSEESYLLWPLPILPETLPESSEAREWLAERRGLGGADKLNQMPRPADGEQ